MLRRFLNVAGDFFTNIGDNIRTSLWAPPRPLSQRLRPLNIMHVIRRLVPNDFNHLGIQRLPYCQSLGGSGWVAVVGGWLLWCQG